MGFTGDRGSVTAGVEYSKEDPVWARDRWFSEVRFPTGEKSAPRPGGTSAISQYGRFTYDTGRSMQPATRSSAADAQPSVAGLDPANFANYRAFAMRTDNSNPNQASTVYSGIERRSVFLNGQLLHHRQHRFRHRRAVHGP